MDSELLKQAALAIKDLKAENEKLTEKLAVFKKAEEIAFDMLRSNIISVEDLESVINDFSNKTLEELEIVKLAKNYSVNTPTNPFKLTGQEVENLYNLDSFTRMLIEDI